MRTLIEPVMIGLFSITGNMILWFYLNPSQIKKYAPGPLRPPIAPQDSMGDWTRILKHHAIYLDIPPEDYRENRNPLNNRVISSETPSGS